MKTTILFIIMSTMFIIGGYLVDGVHGVGIAVIFDAIIILVVGLILLEDL